MKKIISLLLFFSCAIAFSFGQTTVRGKITDEKGETLIGVAIVLKTNRGIGTTSDLDGNFSFRINDSLPQTIVISYLGYIPIEENITKSGGNVVVKNFVMKSSSQQMKEVEVTAKVEKSREYYVEKIKKNSATTLDYISSETIKKTGDNNVTSAIARVTGVSTNGAFITVRGIGDRYVKSAINGMRIPTLDPYTNNIKLDLFPASLVDNVFITKTASPDIPGDWAGAYISVETKDYPEQLSVFVETTIGYNQQTTGKDVLTSQTSPTDWLGYDNGFRDHNHNTFVSANMSPSRYQEFVALGLGNFYNSIGVNDHTPWNDTYYKLGLVQLNLLAPAQFDDANAVANAKISYETGPYQSNAFRSLNAGVANSGKSFSNNWNTTYKKAPLNFTQSFSIGNQVNLFGKPLGFITGFRYGSFIAYDPVSTANRQATPDGQTITVPNRIEGETSIDRNGWSALASLAYKLNPNNNISIMFMPNVTGVNNVRYTTDYADPVEYYKVKDQFYESRKQMVYQYKSEHYLTASKMKLELKASYTNGESDAPDFKRLEYTSDRVTGVYGIGQDANRSYRYLSENIFDSYASAELPLADIPGLTRKLKFGAAYQNTDRDSKQYDYFVRYGPYTNPSLGNVGIDNFFSLDKFDLRSGTFNGIPYSTFDFYYNHVDNPANHTIGYSRVYAGFAMLDYSLNPFLRVSGGLRVEQAEIFTDAFKYDSLKYSADDARRQFGGESLTLHPGDLNEISFLPSINLIYKLRSDETKPVNLRLNYSQSVARPGIREMTDVVVYDYELRANIYGNSDLKMVHINNYDARIEAYFQSGDNVSISFFYKDFKDHIEISDAPLGYTWINVDKSRVAGIEFEGRKVLTKNFELRANLTLADSRTTYMQQAILISNGIKTYVPIGEVSRNMYGQAPYVVNGILTYTAEKPGITATVSYNIQGPRLVISSFDKIFEVYELPRNMLDLKVIKKLGKHFNVSLTVKDILNSPIRRSYNREEGWILDYDKFAFGTYYTLGVAFKI